MAATAAATASARRLFEFDLEIGGRAELAGADEVGRGCLAGPIVAAAVVFDYDSTDIASLAPLLKGLGDSKKLTAAARERLFPLIIRHAARFSLVSFTNRTIDENGLHVTNLRALARSLQSLSPCPATALVDGRQQLEECPLPHLAIIKGDSKSASIAAASIVAKVFRDRLMCTMHERYPQYGFNGNAGYGSLAHRQAIVQHGFTPIHRLSFNVNLPGS
ncbi:MAG: ribonuclease HII [Thermoleophilia bacterium]